MKRFFTLILCAVMLAVSAVPAYAVTLETVESSAEIAAIPEITDNTVLTGTPDIPLVSEYGKLIVYQNFEGENVTESTMAHVDTKYLPNGVATVVYGRGTGTGIVTDPVTGEGAVFKLANPSKTWIQYFINLTNHMSVEEGKYTVIYDYYIPAKSSFMERYFTNFTPYVNGEYISAGDRISTNASLSAGAWTTKVAPTLTATATTHETLGSSMTINYDNVNHLFPEEDKGMDLKFTQIGLMADTTEWYLDNVRVYFRPAAAVMLDMGSACAIVENIEDTYTFPTAAEAGFDGNIYGWVVDGKLYEIGATAEKSVVCGKTLYAVTVPTFDNNKGQLVAFYSFEDKINSQHTLPTYLDSNYVPSGAGTSFSEYNGMNPVFVADTGNGNRAMKVVSTNDVSRYRFGVFPLPVVKGGKFTVSFDAMGIEDNQYPDLKISDRISNAFIRFNPNTTGDVNISGTAVGEPGTWITCTGSATRTNLTGFGININAKMNTSTDKYYLTPFYIDNIAVYCYPDNLLSFAPEKDSDELTRKFVESDIFTFPSPEDLGYDGKNFVKWTCLEGGYYDAGETAPLSDVTGKTFYPFIQDASLPAVISLYEGDIVKEVSKSSYNQIVVDDGRDTLHTNIWGTTWTEGSENRYMADARLSLPHTGFDASEYRIIHIMAKVTDAYSADNLKDKNTTYSPAVTSGFAIYNHIDENNNFNADSFIQSLSIPVDNEYHLLEIDMTNQPSTDKYPWASTGFGFEVDVNRVSYGGNSYIDYVRIYRSGINTITYNTNAPAGAEIIKEVETDTGRGLGTGYILKDMRPEVEGYVFKGWATEADSKETVTTIDVDGDETVYAVWESTENGNLYTAPEVSDEISYREDVDGIRFKSTITSENKTVMDEYGFIVSRADILGENELTFNSWRNGAKLKNAPLYVMGIAYKAGEKDYCFSIDTETGDTTYTAVCINIPEEHHDTDIIARPYAKYLVNGKAVTLYGNAKVVSYNDIQA